MYLLALFQHGASHNIAVSVVEDGIDSVAVETGIRDSFQVVEDVIGAVVLVIVVSKVRVDHFDGMARAKNGRVDRAAFRHRNEQFTAAQ